METVVRAYLEKIHPTTGELSLWLVKEFPTIKDLNKWVTEKGLEGYDISRLIVKTEEK